MPVNTTTPFVDMLDSFQEGDIVTPLNHGVDNIFYGVVAEINRKEHKVYVLWSGGKIAQHDPDEIHLYPIMNRQEDIQRRYRTKMASTILNENNNPSSESFAGNPDVHGLGDPVGGGTDVMQKLVKKLHEESLEKAGLVQASDKNLRSRRAVYHRSKGRIYQRSQAELNNDMVSCPKCKVPTEQHSYSRGVDLHVCPTCGWKTTSDKVL